LKRAVEKRDELGNTLIIFGHLRHIRNKHVISIMHQQHTSISHGQVINEAVSR
jgi:hypothetical protein